jgi:hypothetical protein
VSLLFRRLRTLRLLSSKRSLCRADSELFGRYILRNGCRDVKTFSETGASLTDGSFVRCCRGGRRPDGMVLRWKSLFG